jgi:NAD(P)H-hydrate repair Nnr-like enzyme with NAD(P)H-hydrate dehydratase domain
VRGYGRAILTPNLREFERLADALGVDTQGQGKAEQLQEVCWLCA